MKRFNEERIEKALRLFADVGGDAVVGTGNRAADCSDAVRVAADGDRVADGLLEGSRLEERLQRLRNGTLSRDVKLVCRPYLVEREV